MSKNTGNLPSSSVETARQMAKKNIEEIKNAQEQFLKAMTTAQSAMMQSTGFANKSTSEQFNEKAFAFIKENIDSGYEFAQKMVDATDMAEAMELQNQFFRQQIQTYTEQAQALSDSMIHNKDND